MVRAHPTVPLFNDLADRSKFLALFWLGGKVFWGRREFQWADYAPYQKIGSENSSWRRQIATVSL